MADDLNVLKHNPSDPLPASGPDRQHQLFKALGQMCQGFQTDDVLGAAYNLILNAMRQSYPTRQLAEARYDELFGRNKGLLLQHYDPVTGKRRSIFPFNQVIAPEHFVDTEGFKKK